MAEYYAVLKKAIGKLETNQAEARRTVYRELRNALIEQLKAAAPPLSAAEKAGQRLELEEAIRKVEREAAANSQSPPAASPVRVVPPPAASPVRVVPPPAASPVRAVPPPAPSPVRVMPPPKPASAPAEEDSRSPQDTFRRAIQQAKSRGGAAGLAGAIERAAVSTRTELNQNGGQNGGAMADLPSPGERVVDRAPRVPAPREREQLPASGGGADTPTLDSNETANPTLAVEGRPSRRGSVQPRNSSPKARPSRRPSLVLIGLIAAVVLGGGVLAWSKQIGQFITALEDGRSARPTLASTSLPNSGAPIDGLPDGDAASAKVVPTVNPPVDKAATPAAPIVPEVAATPAPPADTGAKPTATEAAADAANPAGPATPPVVAANENADVGGVPAAQRAVLREESVNYTGVATVAAAVTWRYVDDGANGPTIEADLQVPGRGMKVKITIHKNSDSSLPASHLVEIHIDAPPDMPGKGITKLTRILMKPTEEARGQPLVGAEAKITDGFFWIALSDADVAVRSNLALLRDGEWIDLPFTYATGQRGVLTFEKGSQGDQVFQKAIAAWTTG